MGAKRGNYHEYEYGQITIRLKEINRYSFLLCPVNVGLIFLGYQIFLSLHDLKM
jgi:hypothetical protein